MISLPALPDDKLYRAYCPDHKGQSAQEIFDAIRETVANNWDGSEPVWIETNQTLYFRLEDKNEKGL